MSPFEQKIRAIELRKSGYLYSEISEELGIAKSTAHSWLKTELLSPSQKRQIYARLKASRLSRIKHLAQINKQRHSERRARRNKLAGEEAAKVLSSMSLASNHKKVLCAMLFWCEGSKDVKAGLRFVNSDPILVRQFLGLLRESFEIDETRFRVLVHLHGYHDQEQTLKYWSEVTAVPLTQFNKPYLKPNTGKSSREGYMGCISLRYLDSDLGKLLQMIYIKFSESYRGVR